MVLLLVAVDTIEAPCLISTAVASLPLYASRNNPFLVVKLEEEELITITMSGALVMRLKTECPLAARASVVVLCRLHVPMVFLASLSIKWQ
jgi:hypothetical protein